MTQVTHAPSAVDDREEATSHTRRGSSWTLLALAVSAFAIGTTEFMTNGLLLTLADEFTVPVATTGLLSTGYSAGVVVGGPILAALTLRTPRKRLLVILLAIFIAGNAVCAIAPSFGVLMAGRFVSAISHGAYFGAAAVVAASLVPAQRRAGAIAFMFTGLTLANVLGMPLGTFVGQRLGWREAFGLVVVLGLVGLAGVLVLTPADRAAVTARLRDELRPFRSLPVWGALITTAIGFGGLFASFTYITPLLTTVTGFSPGALTWLLMVYGAGLVAGNWLGGRAADRHPNATIAVLLVLLIAALAAQSALAEVPAAAVVLLFVVGAAGFGLIPPLQNRVLAVAGNAATMISTANIAAFNFGATVGSLAGAATLGAGLGYTAPGYAGAVMSLAGLAVFALTARARTSRRHRPAPAPAGAPEPAMTRR
ncbi:MFS transporter [Bailinhaonella thermotolerans]|uniref:MFS transporter n=1 Tax=Bailinhaonella thermotolerans TaxID=1070861 RepID=A0A3A4AXL9_9ACTN|nr:MFS transporter [Bailinhaonella thermotolerans]RJL35412.1 MFS transporter [Bailinhaonella thermotolerans]